VDEITADVRRFEIDVGDVCDITCYEDSASLSRHYRVPKLHSLFSGGSDVLAVARTWLFASAA
jgi:hypothetical protein